ncbi:MAG: 16S rRNA (cytidine(1402)-2'-O)-methyltransferase, partial [Acidimicrobiia bacterium]
MAGTLILCATPIGNLGDAPPRLREALSSADVIYAEDTRRTATLLSALGVERSTR